MAIMKCTAIPAIASGDFTCDYPPAHFSIFLFMFQWTRTQRLTQRSRHRPPRHLGQRRSRHNNNGRLRPRPSRPHPRRNWRQLPRIFLPLRPDLVSSLPQEMARLIITEECGTNLGLTDVYREVGPMADSGDVAWGERGFHPAGVRDAWGGGVRC